MPTGQSFFHVPWLYELNLFIRIYLRLPKSRDLAMSREPLKFPVLLGLFKQLKHSGSPRNSSSITSGSPN